MNVWQWLTLSRCAYSYLFLCSTETYFSCFDFFPSLSVPPKAFFFVSALFKWCVSWVRGLATTTISTRITFMFRQSTDFWRQKKTRFIHVRFTWLEHDARNEKYRPPLPLPRHEHTTTEQISCNRSLWKQIDLIFFFLRFIASVWTLICYRNVFILLTFRL